MSRRIEAHKRTINRVKWHPLEHHMVATASQDGTLKIWDRRARSRPSSAGSEAAAVTIAPAAGAIRDVTFCYDDHRAAVALEAGVVAVYDKRFAETSLARWVGHGADVHCVQWHPTSPNMLASAAAAPDYTVKIWDVSHTQPVGQAKPLYTISPAGNVHRLRWRPGAPVGLAAQAAPAAEAAGGGGATGATRDARARSEQSMDSSGDYDEDDEGESPHVWQLATECHHRGSVIQVWDVREPVMPIAVVHPPAPSFFNDVTDTATSTAPGSSVSNSSSNAATETSTSLRTPRRQEAVEYVGFEWLDTPSPRILLPEPLVESPKKPDSEVATPWTLFSSLAAKPLATAAPAEATSPFFPLRNLRHSASSSGSSRSSNLRSSARSGRGDFKDAPDDDVYLGLWQHFITTVKVGVSGALLVNSCGGAIQPPSEVAPVAMALSPKGMLATVHQEQPIAHRAIPTFQLASTRIAYDDEASRHTHSPLGIFHVQPQNVNAARFLDPSALTDASALALGNSVGPRSKEKKKPVLCLEALHHKLRHAPLNSSLLARSQQNQSTGAGPDITAPWFGGNSSSSNNRLAVRKGARGDAWSSSYGDAFAGLLRSPETTTVANRRCIEMAPCEGAVPNQLAWTRSDLATWEVSEKRRDILRVEAAGGGDGAPLPEGALAVNAAELTARVLGHGSALAMQLLLDHNPASLSSEVR